MGLTGGNRHDIIGLIPLLDDLKARPVKGKPGRPRQKPDRLLADRGYDFDKYRRLLRTRGITPVIARRGVAHGSGVTAWRRLRDWQAAGVWDALHQRLLEKLNAAGAIDWSRAAVDGSHVRALLGGS